MSQVTPLETDAVTRRPANGLIVALARLDKAQRIRLGAGAAALLVLLLVAFFMSRQPDWRVLYSQLSDRDGGAIVGQLTQMGVPYRYSEGGGAIMVPAERVHDVRLRLASQGLPKGSVVGFELLENQRFGTTQFQERLNFQRGLEGELTRSIQSLSSVQSARVHLALPQQNGFFRAQQKPSASVLVTLHPGRTLDKSQIAGIVHLVASSVPDLHPKAVSVVDDAGNLLSSSGEADAGADLQKLQYVQHVEQLYTRRILDILEPLVGASNVRAQVSAEIDFSQVESTSEQHRPNQGPDAAAVRSQQLVEDGTPTPALPAGVPGAVSNTPPTTGHSSLTGNPGQPGVTAQGGEARTALRRESVVNYEVDRTVRVVRESAGQIRRLSAAVVINHRPSLDRTGRDTLTPIPPEQLEQMTALVRESIGFNAARGDSVNVVNAPFTAAQPDSPTPVAWWQRPELQEWARQLAWPLTLAGIAVLMLLGLVRPGVRLMRKGPMGAQRHTPQLDALVDETPERPGLPVPPAAPPLPSSVDDPRLDQARRLAQENPAAVASIVKSWVHGEATA